jgi:hypothetical protein
VTEEGSVKIKPVALGLSLGIVWGGALFITTWLCYLTGYGKTLLDALAISIYPGYIISPAGSFIGLFYGFIDLAIMRTLTAWLYNKFEKYFETSR